MQRPARRGIIRGKFLPETNEAFRPLKTINKLIYVIIYVL